MQNLEFKKKAMTVQGGRGRGPAGGGAGTKWVMGGYDQLTWYGVWTCDKPTIKWTKKRPHQSKFNKIVLVAPNVETGLSQRCAYRQLDIFYKSNRWYQYFLFFFFFFFCQCQHLLSGLELASTCSTPCVMPPSLFALVILQIGSHTFCLGQLWTMILLPMPPV
jgi:hypothetical protein